jgi:hypothetical protein
MKKHVNMHVYNTFSSGLKIPHMRYQSTQMGFVFMSRLGSSIVQIILDIKAITLHEWCSEYRTHTRDIGKYKCMPWKTASGWGITIYCVQSHCLCVSMVSC